MQPHHQFEKPRKEIDGAKTRRTHRNKTDFSKKNDHELGSFCFRPTLSTSCSWSGCCKEFAPSAKMKWTYLSLVADHDT
jgi:hypothetical protein